ncbi:hypothetical protein ACFOUW_14015 [Tenggerimyces flavus]|uniref:Uncharacterized protein n=1 Tax=Tenggerimyces flavus TaxID=1708749 RepID=A0ABV7YA02_9ACTN|nr:hypothetical protein [Tenggerimyces flavus]
MFSMLVPVMLVGLIFPSHRGKPFLRRGGLVVVGVVAAAATFVFLVLTLPLALRPGTTTVFGGIVPDPVPIVLAALVALGIGWAVVRWSAAPRPSRSSAARSRSCWRSRC